MHRAEPFKLTAFEEEAFGLVQKAKAAANHILHAALEQAKSIRNRAYQDGLRKGVEEGRAQAVEIEKHRIAQETAGLADVLRKIADGVEEKRRGLAAAAEQDIVRLAVAVAERIVKREIEKGATVALENLKHAISLTASRRTLEVLLNPADFSLVETYLPELRRRFLEITDIRLVGSEDVARGGCLVLTKEGAVDADVKTQLDEVERQLLS